MRRIEGDLYRNTLRNDRQQRDPAQRNPGTTFLELMTDQGPLESSSPEAQRSRFYPSEEPPRFLYPNVQIYDRTVVPSRAATNESPASYLSSHGQYTVTAASLSPLYPNNTAHHGARPMTTSTLTGPSRNTSISRRSSHDAWSPYENAFTSAPSRDGRRRSSDLREKAQESSSQ